MYVPRQQSDLGPLPKLLGSEGIAAIPDIYSREELIRINKILDPFFAGKSAEARSYAWPDDMIALGLFEMILSPSMKELLFSILPNPVLYHMLCSEIAAGNTKSHVFSEQPGGWHRDIDCSYIPSDPTHISVTIYLTDVNTGDGTFEIVPQLPDLPLESDTPIVSVTGAAGRSFVWHRSFYHRAAPNSGPVRRRIVKFSIQPNEFISGHLKNYFFRRTVAEIPSGDPQMDILLGRYQTRVSPLMPAERPVSPLRMPPTATLGPVANQRKLGSAKPRYMPRDASDLGPLPSLLARDGVTRLPDIYPLPQLARINAALNPFFASKRGEAKAYAWADDLLSLNLFGEIFSPAMMNTLFSMLPDPLICHFHASEIAGGNAKPNIYADQPGGWHRDPDASYFSGDPTHLSLFVYLTEVGTDDGALEVSTQPPDHPLRDDSEVISIAGGAGLCVAWHRSFYYRERPNLGPRRRRVIKISIQRNHFPSPNLGQTHFTRTLTEAAEGDPALRNLFGTGVDRDAKFEPGDIVLPLRIAPTSAVSQTTSFIRRS